MTVIHNVTREETRPRRRQKIVVTVLKLYMRVKIDGFWYAYVTRTGKFVN